MKRGTHRSWLWKRSSGWRWRSNRRARWRQLRQELEAAEAAVAAFGPSPEQLREEAAKAEQLAKESGTPAKSAAVIRQLERRWREFLDAHGEALSS